MQIKRTKDFTEENLQELFSSVNWKSAENPQKLVIALKNSTNVISAWENDQLIGIIRSMDDGCWSANIDCLVVHKEFQGKGIASKLITELLDNLNNVEYINVCPDDKTMNNFYLQFGFNIVDGYYLQKVNT